MVSQNNRLRIISLALNILMIGFCVYVSIKALEYRAHINEFLDKYTHVVQEFSSRERYLESNRKLASDTIIAGRVVFFGMTATELWPVERQFLGYEAINRGVAMQRLAGLLLRFRSDVISLRPEWVVIEVSSYNLREPNSLEELVEYMADMAELADYNGIKPILTTLIPPTEGYKPFESDYAVFDSLHVFNNRLRTYAQLKGFALVDIHALLAGEDGAVRVELTDGGIIPNEVGYRVISEAILAVLSESK